MDAFYEREMEFKFDYVTPFELDGVTKMDCEGIMCAKYTDEAYRRERNVSDEEFEEKFGRYGITQIWMDDIFPCRVYLRHCVLSAEKLGQQAYDSFMDHSYLGDRTTTIRMYLEKNPDILEEEPPASLAYRYSG